jgi:hypothetical protein
VTINDLRGLGDGFIYTTDTFSPGSTTLVYVDTRDSLNAGVPFWSSSSGETVTIAWADDSLIRAQAAAYTPWTKLADAVYAPGVTAQVAPAGNQPLLTPAAISPADIADSTPVFGRFLSIGGLAIVNTTEGDTLNVRAAPTRDSAVMTRLPDGDRVTIVDGPRAAEGFTWWKVRTGAGVQGWVVESVDDNGSRLQTLIPEESC